jgi:hypothetical protein
MQPYYFNDHQLTGPGILAQGQYLSKPGFCLDGGSCNPRRTHNLRRKGFYSGSLYLTDASGIFSSGDIHSGS